MSNPDVTIGYGTVLQISDSNSPGVYVDIGEVVAVTPPGDTVDQVDATHMQSPNRRKQYVAGLVDGGEGSFEINYIPGSITDSFIIAWLGSGDTRYVRLTYPNHVTETFPATPTGYTRNVPLNDKMSSTLTVKKAGDTTFGNT